MECKQCDTLVGPQYYEKQDISHFSYPCFNPNNNNEFVCLKKTYQQNGSESYAIMKYNTQTNQSEALLEWSNSQIIISESGESIKWGLSNHILFNNIAT